MSKNPEFAKYASDLARHQDALRTSNEDLIKLSQRFGRMMPKLARLDPPAIISWFGLYNRIKDAAGKTDEEASALLNSEMAGASPVLQFQIRSYCNQRQRLYSKMEVMDDILSGMMEDLLENGSFEDAQKQEMRSALDGTMEKSKNRIEPISILA